jgi:O-antigen/teichoic acid export membrane protein
MSVLTEVIRPGLWVIGATGLVNIINLIYHLFMVRFLSPSDYGALSALLAFLLIITVPAGTVQTTISQRVASACALNDMARIRRILRKSLAGAGLGGLMILGIVLLLAGRMTQFLKLDSTVLVVALGLAASFMLMMPVVIGGLQGLERFFHLGLALLFSACLKLLLGVALVLGGWAVVGAMHGFWLAALGGLVFGLLLLKRQLRHMIPLRSDEMLSSRFLALSHWMDEVVAVVRNPLQVPPYAFWAALGVLAYTALTNLDVVLTRYFFPPHEAGYYAIAAMVARMVLFLPAALSIVLLPKVAHRAALGQPTRPIFFKIWVCTGSLSGLVAVFCFMQPAMVLVTFTGAAHPPSIPLVRILSLAMVGMSLVNVELVYHLGIQAVEKVWLYLAGAFGQMVLVAYLHRQLESVAWVTFGVAWGLAVVGWWSICNDRRVSSR